MTNGEMMYLIMVIAAATLYASVLIYCTSLTTTKK